MKKVLAVFLVVLMLTSVAVVSASAAETMEDVIAETLATIEEFNEIHGGQGALIAEVVVCDMSGRQSVVVTGEVTGATSGLTLHDWTEVTWRATLHGNALDGEPLIRAGSIMVEDGAEIVTDGVAIESGGHFVAIGGGVITAATAICAWAILSIFGGVINGDVRWRQAHEVDPAHVWFHITGGEINGSIFGAPDAIYGGVINASAIHASALVIRDYAQVFVDCVAGLEHAMVSVEMTATENFTDRLMNWIQLDADAVVHGHVVRRDLSESVTNWGGWSMQLIIPQDTSLTLGQLRLNGGTIVIDGELILPEDHYFGNWMGFVTGINAGELAGLWPRVEPGPEPPWYSRLPDWAQLVLRVVLFGWIWMEPPASNEVPVTGMTWEAGGGWFATLDEAALDWALTFVPRTIEQDAEFGAILYRRFNWRTFRWGYSYSKTIRGETYAVLPLPPAWLVLFPFMAAGAIHTHPYGSNSYFSSQDLESAQFWMLIAHYSYVAGPDGSVRRYDARTSTFELIHDASDPNVVLRTVANYNEIHGGTGELIATITGPREVTITGEVTGVTRSLDFFRESGISIILDATIIACPDNPPWELVYDIRRGGELIVAGGVLHGGRSWAIDVVSSYHTLTITGGEVHGRIWASTLRIEGGTIHVDDGSIHARIAYIAEEADITLSYPMQDFISANAEFTEFIVIGDTWTPYGFRLGPGQTLTIPEDASLEVWWGNLMLDGGVLIIDGELIGEPHVIHGTITGTNAGELAGTQEPQPIRAPWWDRLPWLVDFILRYYAFGWWWYRLV